MAREGPSRCGMGLPMGRVGAKASEERLTVMSVLPGLQEELFPRGDERGVSRETTGRRLTILLVIPLVVGTLVIALLRDSVSTLVTRAVSALLKRVARATVGALVIAMHQRRILAPVKGRRGWCSVVDEFYEQEILFSFPFFSFFSRNVASNDFI
ncbi:hypothetical protein ACLOJK_034893 [Asimina triloba]